MKGGIRSLIEPRSRNEDDRRREYILNIILAGSIVALVFFDALVAYYAVIMGTHSSGISLALFSILPAFFIFLYVLSRRGFFALASYLLIAVYFVANSYAAYSWGANLPTSLVGYALLIVIASILISTRFGFFVTAVAGVYVFALWNAQLDGVLVPSQPIHLTDGDAATLVVLYGLIVIVAWLSNREIEKSLARARRSERELKEERDSLESKVEERTRELHMAELEKIDHLYRFAEFGQLASGLFHDLLNFLQVLSLRAERDTDAKKLIENAFSVQGEIDRFRDAFRKQLSRDDVKEIFSLATSVESVCQFLSYQAKTAGVHLEFERGDGALEYFGSPLKFHQVVMNLVLNAIEAHSTRVVIGLTQRKTRDGNAEVVLTVTDNGDGIASGTSEKIFDPFFTTKQTADKQGTGIGLAITKRIITNDLGGTIAARNAEVGSGAIFTVSFPLVYEQPEPTSHRKLPGNHQERTTP